MFDLSLIIVTWNVWNLVPACLRSIEANSQPDFSDGTRRRFGPQQEATLEVIVVDNASQDEIASQLPKLFPWVKLIRSETNLGFTKGNNLGYRQSSGNFVFFLNPDTEVSENGLWSLYSAISADPAIGMVGPRLLYGDQTWQNSRRHFPTPLSGFFESTWLGRAWPGNPWARHWHMLDSPADQPHEVDWLMGAAMLARREALESVLKPTGSEANGPFDEAFFMYSEEMDLCRRIKLAGWRIRYLPTATVLHYEGKSSEQVVAARHIYFNSSKVHYWRKWFGPGWAEVLRHYLLLEFRSQLVLEEIKGRLGHKPALRKARVAVYQEVIASGLRY